MDMFTRIDEKLKGVAEGFFWIEAQISAIVGVVLAITVSPAYLLVALAGVVIAWLSSLLLYCFGEMITELKLNRRASEALLMKLQGTVSSEKTDAPQEAQNAPRVELPHRKVWKCSSCLGFNTEEATACSFCGKKKA